VTFTNGSDEKRNRSLGFVIQERRRALGMTQEELAERVGGNVRQSDISRLERGHVALPRRSRLDALARALDVTPGYLLMRSGWLEDESELPGETSAGAESPTPESMPDLRWHDQASQHGPVPDEVLEESRPLQDAIARAREVSSRTSQLLRDSAEIIGGARQRNRKS
jgi:transcriptional regulator with XRE-family HTH domain